MEILKNHTGSVKFVVPNDLAVATFKVYRGTVQDGGTFNAVFTGHPGVAECAIPYVSIQEEAPVRVVLNFVYQTVNYTKEKIVNVVTPYLDLYEVKEELEIVDTKEATRAEAAVRHVINSHCGQTFGNSAQVFSTTGSGSRVLKLSQRLISLTTINESTDIDWFKVTGDGFYITYYPLGVPPVKADYHGLHEIHGIISNPYGVDYGRFRKGAEYRIAGQWGYENVPDNVREAARLLLGVYADDDTEYRDRYLTSMTAADWRIQFNSGAFVNTGHVRADQLLSDYVLAHGWAVL